MRTTNYFFFVNKQWNLLLSFQNSVTMYKMVPQRPPFLPVRAASESQWTYMLKNTNITIYCCTSCLKLYQIVWNFLPTNRDCPIWKPESMSKLTTKLLIGMTYIAYRKTKVVTMAGEDWGPPGCVLLSRLLRVLRSSCLRRMVGGRCWRESEVITPCLYLLHSRLDQLHSALILQLLLLLLHNFSAQKYARRPERIRVDPLVGLAFILPHER